jgi:hypothetical protein
VSLVHRVVSVSAFAALLAGCGGIMSQTSAVPGRESAPTSHTPQGNITVASPTPSPSPTVSPTPSGTLYAADIAQVYAYPLGEANSPTSAQRVIKPHPTQTQNVFGIATNADGTLDILQTHYVGSQAQYCRVTVESATANGSPQALGNPLCDPSDTGQGQAIARNTVGGFDVLFPDLTTSKDVVRRFGSDGNSVSSTLVLNFFPSYLATDTGGHDYVDTSGGRIVEYAPGSTDPTTPVYDGTLAGSPQLGPIAVSPGVGANRTVYVVDGPITSQYVDALAPHSTTIVRRIGPITGHTISALAVDSQGNLYMATASNSTNQAKIRVYGPTANGTPPPDRVIVPSPEVFYIRGLAISE